MEEFNHLEISTSNRPSPRERLLRLRTAAFDRQQPTPVTSHGESRESRIPLSYAQERLWFLDQMGLVGSAYNVSFALRLTGPLIAQALEHACSELVRRHEILRTRFGVCDGVPYQLIGPPDSFKLQNQDLSHLVGDQERELRLKESLLHLQSCQLNLSEGHLFRAVLVRFSEREHALLLTMHHIIVDGWSLAVLVHELSSMYAAFADGKTNPLPALSVQYADYAIWQRRWLQGKALKSQLAYWRERLEGAPSQLQLPSDRPRPAVESFNGATLQFDLPNRLSESLEHLARREGATLFMVVLAVYQILLARYSGQKDIVVGSPIAGRDNQEIEGLIGFFVNTLVLRTEVSEELTFRQFLERVKEITLGAYAHQNLPFEALVKELRPERNLARQPIFQVMLAVQNFPEEQWEVAGNTWGKVTAEHVTTHFDMTLYLYPKKGMLSAQVEYATDLFDSQTIKQIARHFVVLLEAVVAEPDRPIYRIPLLSENERRQLLVEWNAASVSYPRDLCVHELFSKQAERTPDATALVLGECCLSYADLNAQANRLAHRLITVGVGPDVNVAVYLERGIEMIVSFLGILKAGGAYLPLDPTYPQERTAFMLEQAKVPVVLTRKTLATGLPSAKSQVICLDCESGLLQHQPASEPVRRVDPSHLAYVLYTSGSTGRPKAVGVVHRNIVRLLVGTDYINIGAHDVFLQLAPPTFDASTFEIWGALLYGARLVLYPEREIDLEALQRVLQRNSVSVLWLTAGLFHQLMDERPQALSSVTRLLAGGDVISASHARQVLQQLPRCTLINGYGPTEATTFSVCCCVNDLERLETSVPIGRPIANTPVYVLNEWLQLVPIGVGGELYIGGDGLARGYLSDPAMTAQRFVANPFGPAGTRLYRTGDLVRWRANSTLEFLSRLDSQVKIRGYRIEPAEIESLLLEHAAVKRSVVLVREDIPGEKRLVAYVVGDRRAALDAASDKGSENLRNIIVGDWETLYEDTYGTRNPVAGPSFVGWNSSYTGKAIPELEMREWLASTVTRIKALAPERVLEIGCGVGLLLQHLAPQCPVYLGTDFSAAALSQLRQWIRQREDFSHVELSHRSATELQDLEAGSFDTVVLNSVVQYFPDIAYLLAVLNEAIRLLRPRGTIFIGDVRDLGTLQTFHTGVELTKAAATVNVGQLRTRIARAVAQEKELVIDPRFFQSLPGNLAGISAIEVLLKRGQSENELTRYRYDVVLQVGEQIHARPIYESLDWRAAVGSLTELEAALRERRWRAVHLSGIPSRRLSRELAGQRLLATSDERLEIGTFRLHLGELPLEGVDPETIWQLAEAYSYDVTLSPSAQGCLEVRLLDRTRRYEVSSAVPPREVAEPWSAYANDPMENGFRQQLVPQLRDYLKGRLPDYMIPAAWMVLTQLPLTSNGKVDRRALPAPDIGVYISGHYEPPEGRVEETLAEIWQELLRVDRIGRQDNFFELGGHSLLAIKALFRVNQTFGCALRVFDAYKNPTIRELARRIQSGVDDDELVDLSKEAVLNEQITASSKDIRIPVQGILLTGSTGFVGRFLLVQLLHETDATLYCLLRPKSRGDESHRVREVLSKWGLWRDEFGSRIVTIHGDLSRPHLGMDRTAYQALSHCVDSIYHCGTSMNHLETYGMAKATNVGSVSEILKLATLAKPKLVNYISTLGVFTSSTTDTSRFIDEDSSIDLEKHRKSQGYVASKWVAEKVVMTAAARGIPCNIFRLGLVWADTEQGRFDELQREYRLLKSSLLSGYGIKNYRYQMVPTPVDYVARSVVFLGNRYHRGGGIFHISASAQTTDGVFERCNDIVGRPLKLLALEEWISEIKRFHHAERELPIVPLLEFYESSHDGRFSPTCFNFSRTHEELERAGIITPKFNDDILRITLKGMLSMDTDLARSASHNSTATEGEVERRARRETTLGER